MFQLPETKGLTLEQLAALQRQSSRPPAGTDNDEASLTLSPQEIEMP